MSDHPNSKTQKLLKPVFYKTLQDLLPIVLIKEAFDYICVNIEIVNDYKFIERMHMWSMAKYIRWDGQFTYGHSNCNGLFVSISKHMVNKGLLTLEDNYDNVIDYNDYNRYFRKVHVTDYGIHRWPLTASCGLGINYMLSGLENEVREFDTGRKWKIKNEFKNDILKELTLIKQVVDSDKGVCTSSENSK